MNYPAAELRGIKMNFYLINPDAEHRGLLLFENPDNLCSPARRTRLWQAGLCPKKAISIL